MVGRRGWAIMLCGSLGAACGHDWSTAVDDAEIGEADAEAEAEAEADGDGDAGDGDAADDGDVGEDGADGDADVDADAPDDGSVPEDGSMPEDASLPETTGPCMPGDTENVPCGVRCGTSSRICLDGGTWGEWSDCLDEGECSAGDTESRPCACGGSESRTCNSSCNWGSWSGCPSGVCSPGAVEYRGCSCGSSRESRTCSSSCTWGSWSGCPVPSHMGTGRNNDPCSEADGTWRCVWDSSICSGWVSQVCRGGVWVSYHCRPADCEGCCPAYSSACD